MPLRLRDMKHSRRENQSKNRERPAEDESLAELMSSYTPEQRRAISKGLRILAKVAVRAHMRRLAADSSEPETQPDGGGAQEEV